MVTAAVTGSKASSPGPDGRGELRGRAGPGQGQRRCPGERGGERLERARLGGGQDDKVGRAGSGRPGQFLDRRVRAEVVDPPPVAVQGDAEDH